jgi:hypothetical protein
MNIDLLIGPRNLLALCVILSVSCFHPEISFAVARPFISLWRRFRIFQTSMVARFRSSRHERFWKIDMTKFEP